LHQARRIAREVGLRYVYEGNIYSDGANTYCSGCGNLLVKRSWHDVMQNRIRKGACPDCGFQIAGVWENTLAHRGSAHRPTVGFGKYGHLNL
jgi:pyruvate formate lyase activating enzyme